MRLKHLHIIGEYKNLKDFKLDFDGTSFIDVFVGKNGTGKSNLFEAIIEIFRHLFESDYFILFDYKIVYELNRESFEVLWEKDKLKLNGTETKNIKIDNLPDNIIIYYSGHNTNITELVTQYEDKFKTKIKKADINDTREFIGIGKDYKSILLSNLLIQKDNVKAKEFICKKLGIVEIGKELRLTLRRPYYADSKNFDIIDNDDNDRFWKPEGITKTFLERLRKCQTTRTRGPERREGYLTDKDVEEYIFYYSIELIQKEFADLTAQELFRQFDNLKTIEMLGDISIEVKLENGLEASINNFSDGQFQTVYIYSIMELFKDKNCLTLLDEPDAFLHPEWQFDFLKQVLEITDKAALNNHVLMTSHSASTITSFNENAINLFEINGNTVKVNKFLKSDIIKTLSSGLITFSESEAKLNINHFLNNTSGAVLFTEGITDEMILETAWNKLYLDVKPNFEIQNAFDRIFLRNLFSRDEIKSNYPHRRFFALFDFDEAYDDWNGLTKKENDIITDPFLGLTRKINGYEIYAMLLPVPNISLIKKQVLKDDDTPWGKGTESHLSIELLFFDGNLNNPNYSLESISGGGQLIKFKGEKANFAKNIVPNLPVEAFEIFRPTFEFIKSKIPNP